jgi:hypothetical protein
VQVEHPDELLGADPGSPFQHREYALRGDVLENALSELSIAGPVLIHVRDATIGEHIERERVPVWTVAKSSSTKSIDRKS